MDSVPLASPPGTSAGTNDKSRCGFTGPAGIAPAIAHKIAADVADVLKDPAMVERMHVLGIDPIGAGPEAYAAQLAGERIRMEKAVKLAGARAD